MRDPIVALILVVGVMVFLFGGEPDIHDLIKSHLASSCPPR